MKSKLVYIATAIALILLTVSIVTVMAPSVTPTLISWSNIWEQGYASGFAYSYKFEGWYEGSPYSSTVTIGGNTISVTSSDGKTFSWTATLPISAVIVKTGTIEPTTGDYAYLYEYGSDGYGDTGLYAPGNKGISHVTFYWNVPHQEIPEVPLGTVAAIVSMMIAFAAYFTLRKPKSIQL